MDISKMAELERNLSALAETATGDQFMATILNARNNNPSAGVIKTVTEADINMVVGVYKNFVMIGDRRSARLIALAVQYSKWATGLKAKFILEVSF